MSEVLNFDFKVDNGEQLDVKVVLPKEKFGVIHGVVVDHRERPVECAVVKLFEVEKKRPGRDKHTLMPITHTFTDDCGQFIFGPLCSDKEYVIKIWVDRIKVRCETKHLDTKCHCLSGKRCYPCDGDKNGFEDLREELTDGQEEALFPTE